MAETYAGKPSSFYATTGGKPVEGAWYSGQRYLNGQLLAPGEHQPGQRVSSEVIAQTNPNNVAYVEQKRNEPTSQNAVTPFLNDFQTNLFNTSTSPAVRIPTMDELKTELEPKGGAPPLLNRIEEFEKLRTTYDVATLEKSLNDMKAQEEELVAEFRKLKGVEEGKPVALNVITGRVTEEERAYNERLDTLGRQKSRVVDELNTKYSLINTYMNFMGLDYQDAVAAYDREYKKNLDMYGIIVGREDAARSAYESDRAAASANLTMFTNLITKGNLDLSQMSADQKVLMSKLEVQAGLPPGFMSTIKKDANADIIFTTTNKGVTQVGIRNADGTVKVESYGKPTGDGGGADDDLTDTQIRSYTSSAMKILTTVDKGYQTVSGKLKEVDNNGDRRLSSAEANLALQQIIQEVGNETVGQQIFVQAFNQGGFSRWGS